MTISIQTDVALSEKTTYKIGGLARYYSQPASRREVAESLQHALKINVPIFILGRGSNVLVSDKGWPGMVVDVSSRFETIEWRDAFALCQSGALLNRLVLEMLKRGMRGLEKLGGIPGSIGGALVMNAGAFGQCVSDCLVSIDYLDFTDMNIHTVPAADLEAGYRTTIFKSKKACILSGQFRFSPDPGGEAKNVFDEIVSRRKSKHPLDLPNCGSVFRNIPGTPASVLIEQCGLKGFQFGGAEVSLKHANFIVNRDRATAEDVRHVIVHIQKTVFEKRGVLLEPEVVFVGEFAEPLFRSNGKI
ncbi:MAG: UDP-N-acetylmuramate dehydrogenase [Chitinivibrionales bacterium]